MKNGIYKGTETTYYIKDNKILMQLKGSFYKTTESFMQGTYREPLSEKMETKFNKAYEQVKQW